MSTTALPAAVYVPVPRKASSLRRWTEREDVFSWLMIIPPVVFLLLLVGYPLVYGVWLSLENRPVARPGTFVGLANFIADAHDPVFWQVVQNTFVYTFFATVLKMVGGLGLALVMNQDFKYKNTGPRFGAAAVHRADRVVDHCLDVDPRSRLCAGELVPAQSAHRQSGPILVGQSEPGDDVVDHRQRVAWPAVLRHHLARRAANHLAGIV